MPRSPLAALATGLALPALAGAATPEGSSSAFVHLFEWKWSDVAKECEEWLGPKGFTAVQISPPNEHMSGDAWWTRYQPVTYKLVSRSGDEQAFTDMVQRCKKAGVGIYADAVINHIAAGSGTGVAGSQYGNRATPIYSQNDMHHGGDPSQNCEIHNYQDAHEVQYCDLVGLPDLCTSCDYVQKTVSDYLNRMGDIGIAGFRIDAAKHMNSGELGQLLSRVNSNLFRFQEVIEGGPGEAVHPDQYYNNGEVTEFNYPRKLTPNFLQDGKLQYFSNFGTGWGLMPQKSAVVFLDNHDTQRGEAQLTYKNGKLYQLANIFMLAHPYGYPKVMSSYYFNSHDQGPPSAEVHGNGGVACGGAPGALGSANVSAPLDTPWVCEHRWPAVANMVAWRRSAGSNDVTGFQAPGADTIAFCRGGAACVALNRQDSATWTVTLKFGVPPGAYCDVIRSDDPASCPKITVGADGSASVQVPPLGAVAFHVGKKAADATTIVV